MLARACKSVVQPTILRSSNKSAVAIKRTGRSSNAKKSFAKRCMSTETQSPSVAPKKAIFNVSSGVVLATAAGFYNTFFLSNEEDNKEQQTDVNLVIPSHIDDKSSSRMTEEQCRMRMETGAPFSLRETIWIIQSEQSARLIPYIQSLNVSCEEYRTFAYLYSACAITRKLAKLTHLRLVKTASLDIKFPGTITHLHRTDALLQSTQYTDECIYPYLEVLRIDSTFNEGFTAASTVISPNFLSSKTLKVLDLENVQFRLPNHKGPTSSARHVLHLPELVSLRLKDCAGWGGETLFHQCLPNLKYIELSSLPFSTKLFNGTGQQLLALESLKLDYIDMLDELVAPNSVPAEQEALAQFALARIFKAAPKLKAFKSNSVALLADAATALPATLESLQVNTISSKAINMLPTNLKHVYSRFCVNERIIVDGAYQRVSSPRDVHFHFSLEDLSFAKSL